MKKLLFFVMLLLSSVNVLLPMYLPGFPSKDEIEWLPVESLDESSKAKPSKDEDEIKWFAVDETFSKDEIADLYATLIKIQEAFSGLNKAFSELNLSESNEEFSQLHEDFSQLNEEFDKTLRMIISDYHLKKS